MARCFRLSRAVRVLICFYGFAFHSALLFSAGDTSPYALIELGCVTAICMHWAMMASTCNDLVMVEQRSDPCSLAAQRPHRLSRQSGSGRRPDGYCAALSEYRR